MLAENLAQIFPRFDPLDHGLKSIDQLEDSNFPQTQRRARQGCMRAVAVRENSVPAPAARDLQIARPLP